MIDNPKPYASRLLLKSMFNVRDLGGFPTAEGRVTAFGRFLRGDAPLGLHPDDLRTLLDYPIGTVIDLRSPSETCEHPSSLAGLDQLEHHNIPLLGFDMMASLAEMHESTAQQKHISTPDLYIKMLERARLHFGQIFSVLAAARPGACLFHCTHGKDRTGMVAALLLLLAGVEDLDIIASYQVSATYLKPLFDTFIAKVPAEALHFFETQPDSMALTLQYLHLQYDSVDEYLISAGVTDAEIAAVRQRLLA